MVVGLGKIVVLVECIIKKIMMGDELIDVDRLFVVMFINVFVVEMRNWIGEVLEKELKKNLFFLYLCR